MVWRWMWWVIRVCVCVPVCRWYVCANEWNVFLGKSSTKTYISCIYLEYENVTRIFEFHQLSLHPHLMRFLIWKIEIHSMECIWQINISCKIGNSYTDLMRWKTAYNWIELKTNLYHPKSHVCSNGVFLHFDVLPSDIIINRMIQSLIQMPHVFTQLCHRYDDIHALGMHWNNSVTC